MPFYGSLAFIRELLRRHRLLGGYALLCMAGAAVTSISLALDERMIDGVSVWLKPTKFFLSIAVFAGTAAWFFGYIRAHRRRGWLMRLTVFTLILTASFELFWITWQGAHGVRSHFNFDSELSSLMYALMGIGAVLLVATTLPLAWEIARRPVAGLEPAYRLAVICGLVLTFGLGGGFGGYISASGGSPVGEYASALPLFAWNQAGGDLRVAHFLGIHAQQALPLAAIALRAAGWARTVPVVVFGVLYGGLTVTLWLQAVAGRPLISC